MTSLLLEASSVWRREVLLTTSDDRRIPAFAMPGSVHAVQTAMQELIIPILPHAAWEAMR